LLVTSESGREARIYTRVSKFEPNQKSTEDQEVVLRDLCAQHDRRVVEVYREDPGTSAYQEWVKRPEFDRLLEEVQPGNMVVAYAVDRLTRRGMEQAGAVLRVLGEADAFLVTSSDGIDSRRDDAEINIGLRAILARGESKNTSTRSRRGIALRREEGQWLWSKAPYGLRVVNRRLELDPEHWPIARRIADELLAGESVYAVTKRLNADGIPAPKGGTWNSGSVTRFATNPAWAGVAIVRKRLRGGKYFYRPIVLGEESDNEEEHRPPTYVGEGVVTLDEHRRLVAAVDARSQERGRKRADQRFAKSGRRVTRTLLGELARCGRVKEDGKECGGHLMGSGRADDGGVATYTCSERASRAGAGKGTCPGMYMNRQLADTEVGERFITRLAALEPGDPLLEVVAQRWTAHERPEELAERAAADKAVKEVKGAIGRVDDAFADGVMDRDSYERQRKRLTERLGAANEVLRKAPNPHADISPLLDPEISRPAWRTATTQERRALLALAIEAVTLRPAGRRGEPWNRHRVEVDWVA
jgi:DNA invertase Pin-like site-specific DNA recombinase